MRRAVATLTALLQLVLVTATASLPAHADEIAPELETLKLHKNAQVEANQLLNALEPKDKKRLSGVYVAFDTNATDPSAMAACDDDGDYVIVVTDAMLRLASTVARAQSYDEANSSRSIENYAEFVARSQIPTRRLLPPPPGFYAAQNAGASHEVRLREALAFVLSRELAHLRAGDLVCPHPTATHESGDDEWTTSEQRRALEVASSLYPGDSAARDVEATIRALEVGRTEQGALGLLRFFAQLEVERTVHANRFLPTYLVLHPGAVARTASVKAAAADNRAE